MTGKSLDMQGTDEFLLGLIRAAGLDKTFAEFPAELLAAIRGATQERNKLPPPHVDGP